MVDDLTRLYRDEIKKHAADPVGFQQNINPTHQYEDHNPLCGDRILLQLRIVSGQINAAAFDGEACAICLASASLLCENLPGHTLSQFEALHRQLCEALDGGKENSEIQFPSPLLGVRRWPARIRCATLPWTAASKAI